MKIIVKKRFSRKKLLYIIIKKTMKTTNYYSVMYEVKKGGYFPTTITQLVKDIEKDIRKKKLQKLMKVNEK